MDIIDVGNVELDPSPIAPYGVAVRNLDYQLTAKKREDTSREVIMYHFATALCAGVMATVVVGGIVFMPARPEAATTPSAEAVALKEATTACKAEAKEKKISWPANRKFVGTCLSNALKDYHLDVDQLRRELNVAGLRRDTPEETGCLQNVYCEEM